MNFFTVAHVFFKIFRQWIAEPTLRVIFSDKRHVTMTTNPVLKYTISEIRSKILSQEISCETIVKTYIKRIEEVNPAINAVVQDRFSEAIRESKEIDLLVKNGKGNDLILLGVPFSVKQTIAIKGASNRVGSLHQPKDGIFSEDSEVIKRLRLAGAIPLLISNTPEASFGWETYNKITGRTKNPYRLSRSSGGSSGGEATLICCDGCVFGIGSDTAGSIRLPSLWNGICGHKPTPGVVPMHMMFPTFNCPEWTKFTVLGPMAKTISDLEIIMKVLTQNCSQLSLDLPIEQVHILYALNLEPRKEVSKIDKDTTAAIDKICKHLAQQNFDVKRFDTKPFLRLPEAMLSRIISSKNFSNFLQKNPTYLKLDAEGDCDQKIASALIETFKVFCGASDFTLGLVYFEVARKSNGLLFSKVDKWNEIADKMEMEIINILSNNTVLILPTYPSAALPHYSTFLRSCDATYLMIANAFGLPSTQVPIGFNKEGLPIGLQVISGPQMDRLTLHVAKEIEKLVKQGL